MLSRNYIESLEFDLPSALLAELVMLFDDMGMGPLDEGTVKDVPEEQGVYQLLLDGKLVYVGKTDAEAGLRARLTRHSKKIQARQNLDRTRVTFKAVRVYVFTAMDLEELLIKYYKDERKISLAWNSSGFGANDPGQRRDKTRLKKGHFDKLYPIDLNLFVPTSPDSLSVAQALSSLKTMLPYNIRFENAGGRSRQPHPDLVAAKVRFPKVGDTVKNLLRRIKTTLGDEWQITALPGYVIVYKENEHYPEGQVIEPFAQSITLQETD